MPQRHSKNNNDLAFFTYDEKRKLGYGTQRERLGRDSIKPFDACCLCLKPLIDALCCLKGHVFCKECILECLLAQKKDIQRSLPRPTINIFVEFCFSFMFFMLISCCVHN
jgi:nitric oxide synthase-interacting protein